MLHRFAQFVAACTVLLLLAGSLVTSTGSGLSVPDWPTTYGWNMFTFPPSKWVGGIVYEHGHRLIASTVGLLTIVLAAWLWRRDSRRWMNWLGVIALVAVVAQGLLGGLTVKFFLPPAVWTAAVAVHSAHRIGAAIVALSVMATVAHVWSRHRDRPELTRPATLLAALVAVQIALGALNVLSRLDVWINSVHVVVGALVLTTS